MIPKRSEGHSAHLSQCSQKRSRTRSASGWILALFFFVLASCGETSPPELGALALTVDPSLAPAESAVGERQVARMMGEGGVPMDFYLGELVVATDDQAKLDALLARWGGVVVRSTERVGDVPRVHHVKLDPSPANVEDLVAELNAKAPELRGSFRSTDDAAAKLLAVALSEANELGVTVTPNFVLYPDGIASGTSLEAPTGDHAYSQNAFDWPYMKRGGAQDIGVTAAWQAMERAGVLRNKVRIMILDGGFVETADMPEARSIVGDWNVPSLLKCSSGHDCPWHGTMVATAAVGRADNGFGAVGSAAPVGELLAVPLEEDFFAFVWTLERIVGATIFGDPKIINLSIGFELDIGWDIAVKAACLGLCPSVSESLGHIVQTVSATNKLIFASAGNSHADVDNGGAEIEGSTKIPCELPTVICVGGMRHDSTALDPGSNFGTKRDDDSVDIYGPFWVWVGPDRDSPGNHARLVSGTSFSSPFVAGVAALVWASKPELSSRQVWEIIRDTAHVGGVHPDGGHQRRINAFGAVARVLAGAPPSITLRPSGATAPLNREWSVTAVVNDDGRACPHCPLTFEPAPTHTSGNTAFYRFASAGQKTVTVKTSDVAGQGATASVVVDVINHPPVVTIAAPANGASIAQGVEVQLLGSATDANEGPGPSAGSLPCKWSSSIASDSGLATAACNFSYAFTTQGPRTITLTATDPQGLSTSTSITVNVTPPPTNFPPSIGSATLSPTTPNYADGYTAGTTFSLSASATDPENDVPLSYVWKVTSLRPNSTTPYASDVTIGSSNNVSWTPSSTPGLLGDFASLGNACYDGQTVRLRVEVSDSLGNKSSKTLPDIKVYRCTLD